MFTFDSLAQLATEMSFFNADAFQLGFSLVLLSYFAALGIGLCVKLMKRV